jgi:predicted enzyme related to lactoylglutathione lyase
MPDIAITPTQITLATTRTPEMVQFYTTVFALDLQPVSAYGTILYQGMLHNTTFVLCPNTLAEVQADQSRHQFTYTVSDLATIVKRTIAAGGMVQEQTSASDRSATTTIRDPDGNSIVFIQAAETTA